MKSRCAMSPSYACSPVDQAARRPHRVDVLIMTASGADGGMEKCNRELAKGLARNGQSVMIVVTGGNYYNRFLAEWSGIRVLPALTGTDRRWSPRRILQAASLFRRFRPHVIVLPHGSVFHFNNCAVGAWLARIPRVVSILYSRAAYPRPTSHRKHLGVLPGVGLWWHWLRAQICVVKWLSDAMVFATPDHADAFYRAYELRPTGSVVVPHLGADTAEFRPDAERRSRVRSELGLSDQEFCLVYAGRLSPEKGPDLLIDALGRLPAELWSRLRVVIAGDGLLRAEMENRVRAAKLDGTVRFLGRISNVAGLYNAADLVAVPSRAECFGLSLVEAMASGCAVVATAIGGMREIVDEPQEGLLVHRLDASCLAQALHKAILCPDLEKMGQAARLKVLSKYSKSRVLADLLAVVGAHPRQAGAPNA